ncbi:MAG: hypothetical protein N2Z21_00820 [Candidatus Sumerlaeaceae bacterium]|nr:hypothetical protein [Candidatus Sumerlaeaceae bacterium]
MPSATSGRRQWALFFATLHLIFFAGNLLSGEPSHTVAATRDSAPLEQIAENLARKAVGAALQGDRALLGELLNDARAMSQSAEAGGELSLGQAVHYLIILSTPSREEFLAEGELAARQTRNEELRLRLIQALLDDEYYELAQLKGQDRFNRFTRVFNRASSSLSKLALLQPQDAFQLLIDTAYSMRKARFTSQRERRMVYLARKFLQEYPAAAERPEVEELLRQLSEKLHRDRVEKEVLAGRVALQEGDYRAALFHLETATLLDTSHTEARELFDKARQAQAESELACSDFVSVSNWENSLSGEQERLLEQAARALVVGQTDALILAAERETLLRDSIQYALAALEERSGKHERALAILRELAAAPERSPGVTAAIALLDTSAYNLDKAFDDAIEQLREEQKRFVVTGKRSPEENIYAASSAALQSVGASAATVPALFVTDMLVRSVAEHFRTQLAIDAVLDAGAAYLRRYPGSPRAAEVAAQLSELASKSGDPERARSYLILAGRDDPAKLAKLRENEARRLFESAQQAETLLERKRLLEQIVAEFADTKIARSASKQLEKLPSNVGQGTIVLTRKMLAEDHELVRALALAPELVDGNKRNGELSEEGITLTPDASQYSYRLAKATSSQTRTVPKNQRSWIRARALALQSAFVFKASGRETLQRQILPLQIEGGAGASGIEVAPKILPYPDLKRDAHLFD